MKKWWLFSLIFLLLATQANATITTDAYTISSDVTISRLNSNQNVIVNEINSFPGVNLQSSTISSDRLDSNANPVNRWNEAFNDFVYTGLLAPTTSGTLVSTTTQGTAYVNGFRVVKAATANTYTASKDTYVDLSQTGVYTYAEVNNDAAEPAVTANSIRLFLVVTNATEVTTVTDKRVLGISLGSGNDDFYVRGMSLISNTPDALTVTVDTGVCYNGSTRINKVSRTRLTFATANDWWDGVADNYSSAISGHSSGRGMWNYIGVKENGDIKFLGKNSPDYVDTDGTTIGKKRYWYDSTYYWRVIGAIHMETDNTLSSGFTQRGTRIYYQNGHLNPKHKIITVGSGAAWWLVSTSDDAPVGADTINMTWTADGGLNLSVAESLSVTNGRTFNAAAGSTVGAIGEIVDIVVSGDKQVFYYKTSASSIEGWVTSYSLESLLR